MAAFARGVESTDSSQHRGIPEDTEMECRAALAANEQRFRTQLEMIGDTLTVAAVLDGAARLAVSTLADWCLLDLTQTDGTIERTSLSRERAGRGDSAQTVCRCWLPSDDAPRGLPRVLRTGRAEMYENAPAEVLESLAVLMDRQVLSPPACRSLILAPLQSRGRVLGVLSLGRTAQPFTTADLDLAQDLAHRAAVALENAQWHQLARHNENRFRLVAEALADHAIFFLNSLGEITSWNSGARKIFGYVEEEVLGCSQSVLLPREGADTARLAVEMREAAFSGRAEQEGWMLRKNGERFWVRSVLTCLQDSIHHGYIKILRDMTEQKAVQEELRRLQQDFEALNQRHAHFLALLALEWRNSLDPALNCLDRLEVSEIDIHTRDQTQRKLREHLRQMSSFVDRLHEISRLARGADQLHLQRIDFKRLICSAVDDQRRHLEDTGLTLSVATPETPVWVQGDPNRLLQVVNNLLDNAAKFTPSGGRIGVQLQLDAETRNAVLTVQDTGLGIEPAHLKTLWEPFSQAVREPGNIKRGAGLGLAIVRSVVELHGGQVEAASAGPGQGAQFTVRLPSHEDPAVMAGTPVRSAAAVRQLRVLVVEDNRDGAESLRLLLAALGHEVRVAYNGTDGLRLATSWKPDVVVSDIGLPGLDGYNLARQLRADPALADVRLIALTGYGGLEDFASTEQAGFDEHLVKPADPEEIQRMLVLTRDALAGRTSETGGAFPAESLGGDAASE